MNEHDLLVSALLIPAGAFIGVISSVAGSGGLLLIPLFLFLGMTPIQAIATMNVYSVSTHTSAATHFFRKGHLPRNILWLFPIVFTFGAGGATATGLMPKEALRMTVPFLLMGLTVWVALNPELKPKRDSGAKLSLRKFSLCVLPFIAFYDGAFGVSSTTFATLAYLTLLNRPVVESTAVAKVFSATSSTAALIIFAIKGDIVWTYGLAMALGGMLGGAFGARLVIRHGTKLVRWFIIVTSLASSAKLIWQLIETHQ